MRKPKQHKLALTHEEVVLVIDALEILSPENPDWEQLHGELLARLRGLPLQTIECSLCHAAIAKPKTAHLHQGEWIGDTCCWDERLRASE